VSVWWRDVCKTCIEGQQENWFDNCIQWKVRVGDKIKFWKDMWVEDESLDQPFPKLYMLSTIKGKTIGKSGWKEMELENTMENWDISLKKKKNRR